MAVSCVIINELDFVRLVGRSVRLSVRFKCEKCCVEVEKIKIEEKDLMNGVKER